MNMYDTKVNTVIALDVSKYTTKICGSSNKTILVRGIEYANRLIKRSMNVFLYTFGTDCKYHGRIIELPPNLESTIGLSYPHKVYDKMIKNHHYDTIDNLVVVTQNLTDSEKPGLIGQFRLLKTKQPKLKLEIVNVSEYDNSVLAQRMGSYVDLYVLYNWKTKNIDFLGKAIHCDVDQFIEKLLHTIDNKPSIVWTRPMVYTTLNELGRLLSVSFIMYPSDNALIKKIKQTFDRLCDTDEVDDILRKNFAIKSYRNFVEHKTAVEYETEMTNAMIALRQHGTVNSAKSAVSLPLTSEDAICTCNDTSIIKYTYNGYPNSRDEFGNVFFGIDTHDSFTRQALNEIFNKPSIFHVANIMSICCVHRESSDKVMLLRKLAIRQASESTLIAKDKYDKYGCYHHWRKGRLIPMSYDDDKTHTSLFSDDNVNHFKLPESLWWALMMSMLGIFEKQLVNYSTALEAYGIEPNEESLLSYVCNGCSAWHKWHICFRIVSWDEEMWVLSVRCDDDGDDDDDDVDVDIENYVHEKFPECIIQNTGIGLVGCWSHTNTLCIIRGPGIKRELVYKHLEQHECITICDLLTTRRIDKQQKYGLFEVTDIRRVEDVLDEKCIEYETIGQIPLGCLSCGDQNDLVLVVANSSDEIFNIEKCLEAINKDNCLIQEL